MEDKTEIKYDEIKAENKELEAKLTELQTKLDNALIEQEAAANNINTKVNDKLKLLAKVTQYIGDTSSYVDLNERTIMLATINTIHGDNDDFSDYSDDVIKGMFIECLRNDEYKKREDEFKKYETDTDTRHNEHSNNALSLHEQMAKQLKEDFWANRAKAREN